MATARDPTHNSASVLWRSLVEKAGLDVAEGDGGRNPYDNDLVADLRIRLFPGTTGDLGPLLDEASPPIPVEDLVRAFLTTIAPFGKMKLDILEFLAAAGARRGEGNLTIRFHFDPDKEPLDLLLEEFRDQMEVLSSSTRQLVRRKWDYQQLWQISQIGQQHLPGYGVHDEGETNSDPLLRAWLQHYSQTGRFELVPDGAWQTGIEAIDDHLPAIAQVHQMLLQANLRHAPDHEGLRKAASGAEEEIVDHESGFTVQQLWQIESDFWPRAVVDWLDRLKRAIANSRQGNSDVSLQSLEAAVVDGLNLTVPASEDTGDLAEVMTRRLEDVLNLPIWKRRNEVYAVWIAAQIWRALEPDWSFRFHLDDGVLSFAFSGVHLATAFHSESNNVLAFWTELRTLHQGLPSGKRTTGIQPDYRLLAAPFKGSRQEVLVVEVKQYKRSSTSNFAAALEDYSFACPRAGVLLANYGPVSERVLEALSEAAAQRSAVLGHVRPDFERDRDLFRDTVRGVVLAALDGDVVRGLRPPPAIESITLIWNDQPRDLDLHLYRHGTSDVHVWYNSKAYESSVRLNDDVTDGRGPETMALNGPSGVWIVAVHLFGDDTVGVAGSGAVVSICYGSAQADEVRFSCPDRGAGRWWTVCVVDTETGQVRRVDRLGDEPALS